MKFFISTPNSFIHERKYIVDVIFKEFFGIDYELELGIDDRAIRIFSDDRNKHIILPDIFFSMNELDWLQEKSLPKEPLERVSGSLFPGAPILCSDSVPVIYGIEDGKVSVSEDNISLPIDIFGSAFFMLTRYEEVVRKDRDMHDRFPASASLAFREKFLTRPIINEYLEILWASMKILWPEIERKERKFEMVLSHDVDRPFKFAKMSFKNLSKVFAADILRRRFVKEAFKSVKNYYSVKKGNIEADPFNTFDFIMDLSEKAGVKSCFYFISDNAENKINCDYFIDDPLIINLMKKIHGRGHEIGLHPSYNSYNDPEKIKSEFIKLKKVCSDNGIVQSTWGSRQHYLRFKVPNTWRYLNDAEVHYDSSLSYADHIGFRCGICYDYPVYDVLLRKRLEIIERPLIVMEKTILDSSYMNLGLTEETETVLSDTKKVVEMFRGKFVLLWHNSAFDNTKKRHVYRKTVES